MVLRHVNDQRIFSLRVDFCGICVGKFEDISGEFDDCCLETETNAQERFFVLARPLTRSDFAFDSALSEATGNDDAAKSKFSVELQKSSK